MFRHRSVRKVHRILVDHADAPGRYALADCPWLEGAVDAKQGVAVILPQIQSPRAKRVSRPAMHPDAALQFAHLLERIQVDGRTSPSADTSPARPAWHRYWRCRTTRAGASDADFIACRRPAPADEVEVMGCRIHHNGTRRFRRVVGHLGPQESPIICERLIAGTG